MAAPSYTYALTNGSTADASQVMQNYNDILNGVTDGTKDLAINALTCNGTANLKGQVNLGDATADDIQFNGSLATSIPIKTNNSFAIGSATLGLSGVYLGNGGAGATCRVISASHATTRDYTVPDCGAAANFVMSELAQTINGTKTFAGALRATAGGSYLWRDNMSAYPTGKKVVRFANATKTLTGSDITFASDATLGDYYKVTTAGLYAMSVSMVFGAAGQYGFVLNGYTTGSDPNGPNTDYSATSILSIPHNQILAVATTSASGFTDSCSAVVWLAANDVIRVHTDGATISGNPDRCQLWIAKIL